VPEVTRHNHFVPRFYLRRWSSDGRSVPSYRTLVPHDSVSLWSTPSIRSIGAQRDLYTEMIEGTEADRFEKWVNAEFEEPAAVVLNRLDVGEALNPADLEALAMFFALQTLRTPAALVEALQRWEEQLPDMIDTALRESVRRLEEGLRRGENITSASVSHPMAKPFRITVKDLGGVAEVKAEVTPGRSLWLGSMEHLLTGVASIVKSYSWSIVRPATGRHWLTSDDPAMRLNYNTATDFDFGGGLGSRGTDLILPLGPSHLLFSQIGHEHPPQMKFDLKQTVEIQRLTCLRAHREVYSRSALKRVQWFRPRVVDAVAVRTEDQEWDRWHTTQAELEHRGEY
jgi:Protein of unknown function (DUF4238)